MSIGANDSGFERMVLDTIQLGYQVEPEARRLGRGVACEDFAPDMRPPANPLSARTDAGSVSIAADGTPPRL